MRLPLAELTDLVTEADPPAPLAAALGQAGTAVTLAPAVS